MRYEPVNRPIHTNLQKRLFINDLMNVYFFVNNTIFCEKSHQRIDRGLTKGNHSTQQTCRRSATNDHIVCKVRAIVKEDKCEKLGYKKSHSHKLVEMAHYHTFEQ